MNYSVLSSFCSSLASRGFSSITSALLITFSNIDLLNKRIMSIVKLIKYKINKKTPTKIPIVVELSK